MDYGLGFITQKIRSFDEVTDMINLSDPGLNAGESYRQCSIASGQSQGQ